MTLSSELCRTPHGRAQTAKRATYVGSGCCRTYLGGGAWVARCKFRDTDGVTRRVERRGPLDEFDKHGKLAEVQRIDDSVVIANAGSGMVRGKECTLWHRENDNRPEWWDQGPEPPPEWQQDPSGMARKQRARRRIERYEFDTQGFETSRTDMVNQSATITD
jgi:hypothetical protein